MLKKEGIVADEKEVMRVLDPTSVMLSYNSLGGTGPAAMVGIAAEVHETLAQHKTALTADQVRVTKAYNSARAIAKAVGPKGKNVRTVEDFAKISFSPFSPVESSGNLLFLCAQ